MRRLREERGSTTLWVLALSLALFVVGGIGFDLWRALSDYRELSGVADAAAAAGASGVDIDHYRATGEVVLDREAVEDLVAGTIVAQCTSAGYCPNADTVGVTVNGVTVTVEVRRPFGLTLLGLAVPESTLGAPLEVIAVAQADASLRP